MADPAIVTKWFDSLSLSADHDGFAKFKWMPPARIQCSIKLKSASSSAASNSVIELVADPAVMAIRVDSLDCVAEHAGSTKPKHSPPASN